MEFTNQIRSAVAQRIGQDRYDLWFDGVGFTVQGSRLEVSAASTFLADRLRRDFAVAIRDAASESGRENLTVDIVVATESLETAAPAPLKEPEPATKSAESHPRAAGLLRAPSSPARARRFRSFEQFIDGECSQLARASVDLVMRQPGEVSPLVIHGPTGTGKTHLLEAIWCQAKTRRRASVLYLTAEQFTTYFLEALKGSGLPSFRRKYRQTEILLIDDIQFLAGKQATTVELTYTIDELTRQHRQLVLASDRPPAQLASALGKDLVNRLCGGLVSGMKPIDQQTMVSISKQWAVERKLRIGDDVHEAVASRMQGDARQLSGILNRLLATSMATGEPISVRMAHEVLHELVPTRARIIRLKDVRRSVCEVFGLEADKLEQAARCRALSQPRMLAMWLARKHTAAGLHEISQFFGRRSHSSAVTAHHTVDNWIAAGFKLDINGQACDVRDILSQIETLLRAS